jgi:hypothetical protein
MGAALERLIAFLMRPRVARVRRWSFLLTLPIAIAFGVELGAVALGARLGLWAVVAVVAFRLGGERGDALRDLLMHPRARAYARAELDVLTVLPRLLLRPPGGAYHRGTFGAALALAFTPVVLTEGVVLHLLLRGGWIAWIVTAAHVYVLIWLWGFALGPLAFPHRPGMLRLGALYRASIPLPLSAVARVERVPDGLSERDGTVYLAARRRVDVVFEFAEPVRVQRPFKDPLVTTRIAVASDDPEALIRMQWLPASATADPSLLLLAFDIAHAH